MSQFKWNEKKNNAAILLAEGYTIDEVAESVGVSEKTIDRWKGDIDFIQEVDRLALMVGVSNRAERLKIAKRIIRQLVRKQVPTHKDLLEWLKYAQGETDGIKLDLTSLFEAVAPVAGSGQSGVIGEDEPVSE
jgi:ParB-like chromosome segregation protein Spo0J